MILKHEFLSLLHEINSDERIENQISILEDYIDKELEKETTQINFINQFFNKTGSGSVTSSQTTNIIHNEGNTDFSTQVNLGVEKASHEWVTILEFDDEFSSIWFKNVARYANAYPKIQGFLPIVVDTDEKGVFAGFTNEATFAANMNTEIGILTNEVLLNYQNFQTSGMVFKKSLFNDYGGFKPSFKLTFVYELLLRLTYNSVEIMTIPKIGYRHSNMREGSIFWNYKNGENILTQDEVSFWIDTAKKEHFFKEDRNIKYEPVEV